jgi:DNA-binding MarR family transcriptional regulator
LSTLPLSTLLSHSLVAYTIEFDNEFEHQMPHRTSQHGATDDRRHVPWLVSMAMWCNCMRFVDAQGVTVGELERLARTTTNLPGMLRWGYVKAEPSPDDRDPKRPGRDAVLRPTRAGERARQVWRPLFDTVDTRWRERFGEDRIRELRDALAVLVGQLDPGLPDCLPILGHGLFSKVQDAPATADTEDLPLVTLLARVLLTLAVEFERESTLSLAISANVLRVLDDSGVRIRDLPVLAGVSRAAVDMTIGFLETHRHVVVEPAPSRGQQVRLTAKGRAAQQATPTLLAGIEERWQDRFGIDDLRTALTRLVGGPLAAGLVPYPDGWRAAIKAPTTLPHYPMVLHRGGFPDGS